MIKNLFVGFQANILFSLSSLYARRFKPKRSILADTVVARFAICIVSVRNILYFVYV